MDGQTSPTPAAADAAGGGPRPGPPGSAVTALAVCIDAVIRSLYHIHVDGLANYSRSPSTLVVTNHQRDADGPIIASALFDRRGLSVQGRLPWFVAREDLFRRGFLAQYLEGWPAALREPMHWLGLAWFLRFMRACPMRRIPERSLREVLEDVLAVCGNLPLEDVLRPSWRQRLERAAGARPLDVADVLRRRRLRALLARGHGLRRLTLARFRALKPWQRAAIDAQLSRFTELLEGGETVLLAPEGAISPDGCFHEMRNALPALVRWPKASARVLPLGITHDFMARGREHVFVNVGPELTGLACCSRRELCRRVGRAVRSLSTVTATQLASDFLLRQREHGATCVDEQRLRAHVRAEAARFDGAGARVDARLLEESSLAARVEDCLEYCRRLGTLTRQRAGSYRLRHVEGCRPSGWRNREQPLRFAGNQLIAIDGMRHSRRKAH